MNCLNDQELAATVLAVDEAESAAAHLAVCDKCRSKVAELRRIPNYFATAYAAQAERHASSRSRLLTELQQTSPRPHRWFSVLRLATEMRNLTNSRRVTTLRSALGLGAALAVVLLIILIANLPKPLSAMERMAKRLREVTSFSFDLEETSDRITGNQRRIRRNDTNYWQAPATWRGTTKIVKLPLPPGPDDANELLVDVEEIYSIGQRGILIDHKKKTFFRTPEMQPDSYPDYSPVNWVQRMSTGSVKVINDLGSKQLNGKNAHGYVVSLGHPDPASGQNAVHVWIDPETDLPIEFRYEERHEDDDPSDGIETWANVMRVYNCQWNINLGDISFEPTAPADYEDTSWPRDPETIEGIVSALRLYADLSGGHYPRVTEFHADEVHKEMLTLAGFTGPSQPEWNHDERFQQIQDSKAGIDALATALRNAHHTGYYGAEVGPTDKDKVLVWWPVDVEDFYFVIYGDLRTENLPLAKWAKLVPAEVAEAHTPVEYSKPNKGP